MALTALFCGVLLGVALIPPIPARYAPDSPSRCVAIRRARGGLSADDRLIEAAREPGIGEVLHANKPMLDMCRALGFSLTTNAHVPSLTTVRKSLGGVLRAWLTASHAVSRSASRQVSPDRYQGCPFSRRRQRSGPRHSCGIWHWRVPSGRHKPCGKTSARPSRRSPSRSI
jgi:hypothetical protein